LAREGTIMSTHLISEAASCAALRSVITSVSHDLQSRLITIRGLAQMLDDLEVKGEERFALERLGANAAAMQDELASGIELLRLATNNLELDPVDLDDVVGQTAASVRVLTGGRVVIECDSLGVVTVDPTMLDAVIRGVAGNACRRAGAGERVTLRAGWGSAGSIVLRDDAKDACPRDAKAALGDPCMQRADRTVAPGLPDLALAGFAATVMGGELALLEEYGGPGSAWLLALPGGAP